MQALLVRTIEKHGASRKNLPRLSTKSYSHTLSLPRWSHSPPNYQYRLLQQQRRTPQPSFPLLHTRSLSSDSTFYSVIHVTERYFQIFHSATHLPWWAVILASTIALRSLLTLPLAVYQNKVMAKMELLQPTVKEYQEAVRHNMAAKCRKENLPYKEANRKIMKAVRQKFFLHCVHE